MRALLALAPTALFAQETTFHVDVKLVNIFVNVTDKNGAIVGGLTKEDFAVFEDNRPQQIAVFERKSDVPLNLTLAIDTVGQRAQGSGRGSERRRGNLRTTFCGRRTR